MILSRVIAPVALCLALPLPALAQGPAAPAADPAKAEVAKRVAARVLPDGIYQKMLAGPMDQMMDSMMGGMKDIPVSTIARIGGISEAEVSAMPEGTLGEMMAILDPHHEERQKLMTKTIFGEMGGIMGEMEPLMRDGMAEAFARRFSTEQLTELDRFFSTPTGSAFASEQWMLMMDPAVMSKMQAMMPKIMEAMPAIMGKVQEAMKTLPKPRSYGDLSDAERKKFDALFKSSKKGK